MDIITDLHIHSRFARATSKDITLDNLEKYARIKGVNLLGTGDFQHPLWNREIKEKLKEDDKGILWSNTGFPFIWQTEISLMFSQGGKRRAVHLLVFAPNMTAADKIISYLMSKGRIDYDGRPIFGISCRQFTEDLKNIDDKIEIIPAHSLTPWFGLFGSDSGFDSIEECFQEQAKHIYAVESGMSASPDMIWRLKEKVNIVSFSDMHSFWPWRIGREATIFEINELSYENIINSIRTGKGLKATIETPPEYGKYHWDGHRNCNFSCSPSETKKLDGVCPKCGKNLTIGVDFRIDRLAKEKEGFISENAKRFYKLIPLHEIIAVNLGTTILSSKKVSEIYNKLIGQFKNEFNILLSVGREELEKAGIEQRLAELILLAREGKLKVKPGFDGEYGIVEMPLIENMSKKEIESSGKQMKLF